MALCTITGFVYMPNGQPARSRLFRFKPANTVITAGDGGIVIPEVVDAATNSAGFLEVTLATGSYTAFSTLYNGGIVVPDAETATLYEVFGGVGPVDPPVDVAPNFTTLPTLLGSTSLGGTITVNLGAASGSPAPVITGVLTRPGASPVAVTQGQQITVRAGDQGGSMSLTATATNAAGVDTETVSRAIPAATPAPTFTQPLPDVILTVGDAPVVTDLTQYTANATSYSVSPTGGAVSISGSSMAVSASAEVDRIYAVTATGPGGTATDTFGVLVGAAAPSLSRLAVHIDSDIDTVGERDDIAAMALWLGNQEDFNLLGFTCSPPDGNHQEYINCINAYASDRAEIISKPGITASDFKTGAELLSLVVDGANIDAPSRGYRLRGESQYAEAHAAAQLLIANARNHGDPASGNPTRKLWVAVQGGYVTLAQALYEAMDPAGPMELPDILDRIRVVGQPNWNSRQAPNSWNYIFRNAWPASGTPGMFGGLWMICGYLQWHAFNRDNGTTDTTFWNEITARSAFGTHLRNTLTRPSGSFRTPHFRAGDAGIWFWLKSAKDLGNFDPTNSANLCGVYRTYEGRNPWPSQTVGYGAGSGIQTANPNPEGITWSPTIWAPELTVSSYAAAEAAVNLAAWYAMVRGYMARYQPPVVVTAPAQVAIPTVSGTGTSRTVSWTAPANNGSTITDYVIRINGAVVADGVGTGTTYSTGNLAGGNYSATVAAVNAIGEGPQSPAATFTIDATAPEPEGPAISYAMDEGSGTVTTSGTGEQATLVNAAWRSSPALIDFNGTDARLASPAPAADLDRSNHILAAIVRLDTTSGNRPFITRTGNNAITQRVFQWRNSAGALQYIVNNQGNGGSTQSINMASAASVVVANEWAMFLVYAGEAGIVQRKNGAVVHEQSYAGHVPNRSEAILGVPHAWGARFNPATATYADFTDGQFAGGAILYGATAADIATVEAELRAIASAKGITLP